jgi:hypothetical protein
LAFNGKHEEQRSAKKGKIKKLAGDNLRFSIDWQGMYGHRSRDNIKHRVRVCRVESSVDQESGF